MHTFPASLSFNSHQAKPAEEIRAKHSEYVSGAATEDQALENEMFR
jgi:hypothetical protein